MCMEPVKIEGDEMTESTTEITFPPAEPAGLGPYRVWMIQYMPFEEIPEFGPASQSPARVTVDEAEWHFTYTEDGDLFVAHRTERGRRHPTLDKTNHGDARGALKAAYEAGLYGVMVYDHNAEMYGFPVPPVVTFQIDAMIGGGHRVALFVNGRLANRRRDVSKERIDAVKEQLLKEEGLTG